MKTILLFLLVALSVVGQTTFNNVAVKTNLTAGYISLSGINFAQGTYLASDEQDLAYFDPAKAGRAIVKTNSFSGEWYWDSSSTATAGDGVIEAIGYPTGRWIRSIGSATPPDISGEKGVVYDSMKRLVQSDATKQQVDKAAMQVATVADMVALSTNLNNGQLVQTGGRLSNGDGGGALFQWNSSSTQSTNIGTVFAPVSGTGRFVWTGNEVRPEMFGAVGYTNQGTIPYTIIGSASGVSDFSIYVRAVWPTFADSLNARGLFRITDGTNSSVRAVEAYGASGYFTVGVRGENGSYSPTSSITDAGYLLFSPNIFTGLAGTTNDFVLTRTGGTWAVYVNGTNWTSSASVVNSSALTAADPAQGFPVNAKAGFSSDSQYWRAPVFRQMFWDRALTAGEAANPSAVSGSEFDVSADVTTFTDSATAISEALNWASYAGKNKVLFGSKTYYSGSEIVAPKNVKLIADSQQLVGAIDKPFQGARIVNLFDSTNRAVLIATGDYLDTSVTLSPNIWEDGTLGYNKAAGLEVNGVSLMSFSTGDGLWLDKVSSVFVKGASLFSAFGHPVRADSCNFVLFDSVSMYPASYQKPFRLYQCADSQFIDSQLGGLVGQVVLGLTANKNTVVGNMIYNSANNSGLKQSVTVNTNTSVYTVSNPHNYVRGQAVWFESTSGGTPPPPYDSFYPPMTNGSTVYFGPFYVDNQTATTFRLHTRYSTNSIGNTGAMQGGYRAVTGTTTGSVSIGTGPVANLLFYKSSGNSITGNRIDQSYADGVFLYGGYANTIAGNVISESGWNGSADAAGVRLIFDVDDSVSGNIFGQLRSSSAAENGIVLLNGSSRLQQAANSFYSIDTNTVADSTSSIVFPNAGSATNTSGDIVLKSLSSALAGSATSGFAFLPEMSGNPSSTPGTYSGQRPLIPVTSTRRLYTHSGSAWLYAPMANAASVNTIDLTSANVWSMSNGSATALTTSGSGNQLSLTTTGTEIAFLQASSDTAGTGVGFNFYRSRGTPSAMTQVLDGDELFEIGAAARSDASSWLFSLARVRGIATDNVTSSAKGGALELRTTLDGTTTEGARVYIGGAAGAVQIAPAGAGIAATSAALDVSSTTLGFLPPRMTSVQRDAISSPAEGLIIFNTTTTKLQVRAGAAWVDLH